MKKVKRFSALSDKLLEIAEAARGMFFSKLAVLKFQKYKSNLKVT